MTSRGASRAVGGATSLEGIGTQTGGRTSTVVVVVLVAGVLVAGVLVASVLVATVLVAALVLSSLEGAACALGEDVLEGTVDDGSLDGEGEAKKPDEYTFGQHSD